MRNPKIKVFRGRDVVFVEKQYNDWITVNDKDVNVREMQMHTTDNERQQHTITLLVKYET